MLRIPKQWLALIALLVLGLLFLEKSPTVLLDPVMETEPSEFPYAYMTDIETIEFDTGGEMRYKMTTPAARYFQLDPTTPGPNDYTLIDHPHILFYAEGDTSPWYLSAVKGHTDASGQRVRLTTNVEAQQDSKRHGVIRVTTSELLVHPAQQYAETDKAVKMRARQSEIETEGMRAYLNEDRIELLSQVRGTYAP
jgi:lipopolysaccharide export system protein LptC